MKVIERVHEKKSNEIVTDIKNDVNIIRRTSKIETATMGVTVKKRLGPPGSKNKKENVYNRISRRNYQQLQTNITLFQWGKPHLVLKPLKRNIIT